MHKNKEKQSRLFCYNVLKWGMGVVQKWVAVTTYVVIIHKTKERGIYDIKSDLAEYN